MIAIELPPPAPPAAVPAPPDGTDPAGHLGTALELRERLRVEQMLSRIASLLLAHAAFDEAVRLLGEETSASRAYVYRFPENGEAGLAVLAHDWCAPGTPPEEQAVKSVRMGAFQWCRDRFLSGEPLVIPDVEALGPESAREQTYLRGRGIRSMVLAPLCAPGGGELLGFMGIDTLRAPRAWSEHESRALAVVAFMVSGTLARARAEEALRRARTREQYVLSASPNLTYVLSLEGGSVVPVWVSPNIERMLGYRAEDVIDPGWWLECMHPDDRAHTAGDAAELRARQVVAREFRIRHANGSYRWIHDEQRLIRDPSGRPVEIVGSWADVTARRHVEDAQREQANLLRALLDSIPVPIFCKDPQGLYFDCNDAFAEFVGRRREEILWRPAAHVLSAAVADEEEASDAVLLARGGRDAREITVPRGDGDARAVIRCRATFRRGDGTRGGIVGALQDITPRKRAEEALAESERHFRSLIEHSADLIAVLGDGQEVTYVSPSVERVLGYASGDVLGRPLMEFVHPDDAPAVASLLEGVGTEPAAPRSLEYRCRDRWGAWRTVEAVVQNRRADAGGVVINARDVTERRAREAELRDHTAALQNAVEAIARIDGEGRLASVNQAYAEILGTDPAALPGTPWADAVHPEDRAAVLAACARLEAGRKVEVELRVQRADGGIVFARTTLAPAHDGEGRRTGWHCFMKDVTGWNQLNAQLQRAQKLEAIGQLAAGVAHEINTPVQYVGDNVRFLRDALADLETVTRAQEALASAVLAGNGADGVPALARAAVEAAEDADVGYLRTEMPRAAAQAMEGLDRVAEIVRAMKEFSHPGTAERTPVDLNRAIQSTLTVARNEWKYVAELVTDFDPALPPVPCLPGDFNQVVLNLVVNAAHAIAEKGGEGTGPLGRITVGTRRDGAWVEVRVADTGTGIPESVRARVFDPFFTTKPVGRGTGQGLTLAHAVVVEKDGGTLHFDSEPGRGTTFVIRLPLHPGRDVPGEARG